MRLQRYPFYVPTLTLIPSGTRSWAHSSRMIQRVVKLRRARSGRPSSCDKPVIGPGHRTYVFQAEMHAFHNPINDSVLASDH